MAATITTITQIYQKANDDRWEVCSELALGSSYPTGGFPLLRSDLGLASTADPQFDVSVRQNSGYTGEYDYTNQKLKLYWSGGTAAVQSEVTNATDVSAVTAMRVIARGRYKA